MAGGIEVDPVEIARRGRAMVAVGAAAEQVSVAKRLSLIVAAMPHSRSALAVDRVQHEWGRALEVWAEAARRHGEALAVGGCDYEAAEEEIRRTLGRREPNLPTPGPLQQRGVL